MVRFFIKEFHDFYPSRSRRRPDTGPVKKVTKKAAKTKRNQRK